MAKIFYVSGDAVQNAKAYRLAKKTGSTYVDIPPDQAILRPLTIPGAIGEDGSPAEYETELKKGQSTTFTPMTKLGEGGYKYYIRVQGTMSVETSGGRMDNVPFQGTKYIDNGSEVSISFSSETLKATTSGDKGIFLTTSIGDIKVYDLSTFTGTIYSAKITSINASGEYAIKVFASPTGFRRTDFIKIDDLTDNLLKPNTNPPEYYCAGAFSPTASLAGYKIAFYRSMSHSSFKAGLTYSEIGDTFIDVDTLKGWRDDVAAGAEYVIFSSSQTNVSGAGEDFVSIGAVYFLLTGEYGKEITSATELAVKAIGDGVFYTDSEYSNTVTYDPSLES